MVSESLRGIISQQLVPRKDGNGRALAMEILMMTPAAANLIRDARTFQLRSTMQTGKKFGMKLMDDSLIELVEAGTVEPKEAFIRAENPQNLVKYMQG
jgi:twitching motility protein PilT